MADSNIDLQFLAEQGRRILDELAGMRGELKSFREDVAATDDENAKVLDRILQQTANLNAVWVDTQANVIRHETRIKTLEEAQPTA